jgi:septation ring formation regulator EzrA
VEKEEIAALLDEKFSEVTRRFDNVDARFDGLESEMRKVRVDLPELKSMLQRNNELLHAVDEKLENFRGETIDHLIDIRSDIRVSFSMLGKRITDLENTRS